MLSLFLYKSLLHNFEMLEKNLQYLVNKVSVAFAVFGAKVLLWGLEGLKPGTVYVPSNQDYENLNGNMGADMFYVYSYKNYSMCLKGNTLHTVCHLLYTYVH